jgi:hypothetical protein
MKDQRVLFFRQTLDALVESLDATARLSRWGEAEAAPEPLRQSAAKLGERLGAAKRLASGKFVGAERTVVSLTAMSGAIERLDSAYVQYRRRIESKPDEREEAAVAFDAELGSVKVDVERLT